jgi:hypothetical protein
VSEPVSFDTTLLWNAFRKPGGLAWRMLELAAVGSPVLDAFVLDSVAAEFYWRATQQGIKVAGGRRLTYDEDLVREFLETFDPLFEPAEQRRAPVGRSLGSRFAGVMGMTLGEALHLISGHDRETLLDTLPGDLRVTAERLDVCDLHVLAGSLMYGAALLCSSDRRQLELAQVGRMRIVTPEELGHELGLLSAAPAPDRLISDR